MSKAVDIMVHHVENIRRVHEREHAELEEARYSIYIVLTNSSFI